MDTLRGTIEGVLVVEGVDAAQREHIRGNVLRAMEGARVLREGVRGSLRSGRPGADWGWRGGPPAGPPSEKATPVGGRRCGGGYAADL
eukprot:2585356-Alexandrium_andersonii.AAC.1